MLIGKKNAGTMYGVMHQGYWNNELLLKQLIHFVKVFEATHPGCEAVFQFDNSTGHGMYKLDALLARASRMNAGPGGNQSVMRDTKWKGKVQKMVFTVGDKLPYDMAKLPKGTVLRAEHALMGQPKGSKLILVERGLMQHKQKLQKCCPAVKKSPVEKEADAELLAGGRAGEIIELVRHNGTENKPCCQMWICSESAPTSRTKSLRSMRKSWSSGTTASSCPSSTPSAASSSGIGAQ